MKIKLSFLLLHTSPLTARQEKTRLWFWHDHSEKLLGRQNYSWIAGNGAECCLTVGWDFSRRQLQQQHFAQNSCLTALARWEAWLLLGRGFHGKTDTSEPDNSMPSILFLLHRFLVANGGESIILQLRHWRGLQTLAQLPAVILFSWVTLNRSQNSLLLNSPLIKLHPSSISPVSNIANVSPQS